VKHVIKTHIAGHQPANSLEKAKLLFGSLQARFELPRFGHRCSLSQTIPHRRRLTCLARFSGHVSVQ